MKFSNYKLYRLRKNRNFQSNIEVTFPHFNKLPPSSWMVWQFPLSKEKCNLFNSIWQTILYSILNLSFYIYFQINWRCLSIEISKIFSNIGSSPPEQPIFEIYWMFPTARKKKQLLTTPLSRELDNYKGSNFSIGARLETAPKSFYLNFKENPKNSILSRKLFTM